MSSKFHNSLVTVMAIANKNQIKTLSELIKIKNKLNGR